MSYQLGPISISGSTVTITGSIATTQTSETTASWAQNAVTASYALTSAGSGNAFPFTGNASISGSLTITGSTTPLRVYNGSTPVLVVSASLATIGIGTTTLGDEANLYLGAKNTNEGGQIAFQPGTNYTTSSFIDSYQDQLRILKGPGIASNAEIASWNLSTLQYKLAAYQSATSFTGTPTANIAVNSSGELLTTQLQGYTLFMQSLAFNPTDAITYYMSTMPRIPTSTDGVFYVTVPKTGTIKSIEATTFAGSSAGSNEAWPWYVRLNSVDTLIATLSVSAQARVFLNQSMNVSVTTGDQLQIKTVCPTWATNPTSVVVGVTIYIE